MLRRQVISHNRTNDHVHTPYKQRTYLSAGTSTSYQDSMLYGRKLENPLSAFDELDPDLQKWVGKVIIINGEQPRMGAQYVLETEIAKYARPHIYRVLYTGEPDIMTSEYKDAVVRLRSKPNVTYRPERLNIFVNQQNKIVGFGYF